MAGGIETKVQCPKCGHLFEITDAVMGPLRSQISEEFEREYQEKLEKQRDSIEAEVLEKANKAKAKEIEELSSQLKEYREELTELRKNEAEFRQERRKWKEEKENLDLEIQRRMDAFVLEYDEKQKLQVKAKDEKIEGLSKKIDELQRQLEQGSQQAQGEVLELTLEEMLKTCFPEDEILPVPKGVKGADVIQRVNGNIGTCCGTIIWESKNTRNWGKSWIDKLRENQQNAKADIAIIASEVLPEGIQHFGPLEGVWVTRWSLATQVAKAMRMVLIELHKREMAGEAKEEKMEVLYDYLTGPQFKQRIDNIVRAFIKMQAELNRERTAMERIWNRREKQLELVAKNTAGLYGDLEAIAGVSMPEIEAFTLPHLLEDGNEKEEGLDETE
jgi:hypothetical protein